MILFYRTSDIPYGCFSNFALYPFVEDDRVYLTSEHYFQAFKYVGWNHEYFEKIRTAKTPKEAAMLGRDRSVQIRPHWDSLKDEIMYHACFLKFTAYESIRTILLGTGDEELVEDSEKDWYWGWGADHTGQNTLGKILMQLRSDLR